MIAMNDDLLQIPIGREKSRSRYGKPGMNSIEAGFKCTHCHGFVTTQPGLSGVGNRNHCPLCLWSRHLDLYKPGDRLSACKAPMQPIGLTIKATRKKYGPGRGELMLIHLCRECEKLSINRIAADDDPQTAFSIFEGSFRLDAGAHARLQACGVRALEAADRDTVHIQLFGHENGLAEMLFKSSVLELV